MKLEILAKRIAQKTNTPELEGVLLRGEPVPTGCMIWTGARNISGIRSDLRMKRGYDGIKQAQHAHEKSQGTIQHEGVRTAVHRLIFQIMEKPNYEYRMKSLCERECCVNPLHWGVIRLGEPQYDIPEMPEFDFNDPWTDEEVVEHIELLLGGYTPSSWADLIAQPLMEEVPHDMLKEQLIKMRKAHLAG